MSDDPRAQLSYATHDPPRRRRRPVWEWPVAAVLWSIIVAGVVWAFWELGYFRDIRGLFGP